MMNKAYSGWRSTRTFQTPVNFATTSMAGTLGDSAHHLLEHGLDVTMASLVVAAVYYARSIERGRPTEGVTRDQHHPGRTPVAHRISLRSTVQCARPRTRPGPETGSVPRPAVRWKLSSR